MTLHKDVDATSNCGGWVADYTNAEYKLMGTDYWCVYCGAKFDKPSSTMDAKQAFSGYSPNFMTPEVLSYKESKDYWVEVSKGEGFDHQPIYGVTVIRKNNQESARDLSQMFHTMTEALQHIGILFGTYKPDDN